MKTPLFLTLLSVTCAAALAADQAPAAPAQAAPEPAAEQAPADAKPSKTSPEQNLKKWDADGDGKVSYEEALKSKRKMPANKVRSWFDKKDTNKDGFLTLDELSAGKTAN